jgi:hypothetical protein
MTRAGLCLLLLLSACGPRPINGDDDPMGSHELASIEVSPLNSIVELDLGATGALDFTATAHFFDGTSEDVTGEVTWSVINPAIGTLAGRTLAIPAFADVHVEVGRVRAELDGLAGEGQITVVAYKKTGPQPDFFFVLPYMPGNDEVKPLAFSTNVPNLDAFFLMDTTGSMSSPISALRTSLSNTVIPGIQAAVANAQFGAGAFRDYPVGGFGSTGDQPMILNQTITNDALAVQTAVNAMSANGGGDGPESGIEALFQVATGQGLTGPGATNVPANNTGIGGVGFRAGSMPVIVQIGDAVFHGPGETCSGADYNDASVAAVAATRAQTKTALDAICARTVGVSTLNSTAACTVTADLEDFATATGARVPPTAWDVGTRPAGCAAGQCCTGVNGAGRAPDGAGLCPLVFLTSNGAGLGAQIVTGIQMLTRFATFDVIGEREGVPTDIFGTPLPAPHTTADFIKQITPVSSMVPPAPPVIPAPTFDATQFFGVTPGTQVNFDIHALNDFLPSTTEAQIFRATIKVLAGGCTDLDQRDVLILVPPTALELE